MPTQTQTDRHTSGRASSRRLGATPATPYTAGFEDYRYARAWDCPWRPGTLAARDYAAGLNDARRAEQAGVR